VLTRLTALILGLKLGTGMDILQHNHHVIWFGDLNYRITLPFHDTIKMIKVGDPLHT